MLMNWSRTTLAACAGLILASSGQAQSLTTTFAAGNAQDGNMFNLIAQAGTLTIDTLDVHFDDDNNTAPACVGAGSCSINEVEVYFSVGGYKGKENDSTQWTLVGTAQHTISTPNGTGQPLNLNLALPMDASGVTAPLKYGMYVTSTGGTNSQTGGINEFMLYTDGKNTFTNTELEFKSGTGNDYPFGGTFFPRTWNGTIYYTAAGGCSSNAVNYCTAGTSASGCNGAISSTGNASATAGSGFTVTLSGAEGAKDGLFFYGQAGQQANSWGNGTSLQCVITPVKRGGLQTGLGTASQCDGGFSQDLNARWCAACTNPNHLPTVGQKMQIQAWYRDPFNTSNQTTSLSDALEVDVCP